MQVQAEKAQEASAANGVPAVCRDGAPHRKHAQWLQARAVRCRAEFEARALFAVIALATLAALLAYTLGPGR